MTPSPETLVQGFRDHIDARDFPCVGAKSALSRGTLKIVPARSTHQRLGRRAIHRELLDWAATTAATRSAQPRRRLRRARRPQRSASSNAACGNASSRSPTRTTVARAALRPARQRRSRRSALLAELRRRGVLRRRPAPRRPAVRRGASQRPALVFNLHDQFEQLRAQGRYERMREAILERDVALAGSLNPMLARHGEASEARAVQRARWSATTGSARSAIARQRRMTSPRSRRAAASPSRLRQGRDADRDRPEGGQVADSAGVHAPADVGEVISNGRTFDYEETHPLTAGNRLWSNRSNPMLRDRRGHRRPPRLPADAVQRGDLPPFLSRQAGPPRLLRQPRRGAGARTASRPTRSRSPSTAS